jgi:predicted metal-dependent peptidase
MITQNKAIERESIFDCVINRTTYTGDKFARSNFWRVTSDRFWQFDDFKFKGIAAASYLINQHRFKIWFNPYEFYKYLFICIIYKNNLDIPKHLLSTKKDKSKDNKEIKDFFDERDQEWDNILDGNVTKHDGVLSKFNFNKSLAVKLRECFKAKTWNFDAWVCWSNELVRNPFVAQNCESVFVHEMFHIIWNHLSRLDERDAYQWNLATDYAINQVINFTDEFAAGLITDENERFYERFTISLIKYLIQTEEEVAKKAKKNYGITALSNFDEISPVDIAKLRKDFMFENNNQSMYGYGKPKYKYANKSAEFYYRVLLETCIIVGCEGFAGEDGHGTWKENGEGNGEGDNEGDSEGDSDGKKMTKGASKGTEECVKSDGGEPEYHDEHNKQRGLGGRFEHKGFDSMEAAAARREVRQTVKDAMERNGVNPDDPDELEKALSAIPGMEILGAVITDWFKVRRKNWRQILKKELTSYANPLDSDYTMSRESRVLEGFFPGKKRERGLDVIFQVDTSGSINLVDWNDFVNQIEEIGRSCDTKIMRCLQVHSVIAADDMVNLRRVKDWHIKETGGTTMKLGPMKLQREGNKKLLIIFTDGAIDNFKADEFSFKIIMFLSRGNSHRTHELIERGFMVINQDED